MGEARWCSFCGCYCVACLQSEDGCDDCTALHPELLEDDRVPPPLPYAIADIN